MNLTSWTVSSLVSQTAGVPLNIPIDGNSYEQYNTFLPKIITIGQILENAGYNQMFMMGSDSMFAGRKNYFEQHGNYKIWDYYTAIEKSKINKDYFQFWGFEDRKLFEFAKEEIIKLSQQPQPFNFSLLTVDTHFFDGYLDDECKTIFDIQYANSIHCSDKKIKEFIEWIKNQEFYENTTIVLIGDHLTMDKKFVNRYIDNDKRTIYNAFINPAVTTDNTKNRHFSVIDMFPTTLASLGVEIEGNKLGLGANLFSSEKTLIEEIGYDELNDEILKKSKYYIKNFLKK